MRPTIDPRIDRLRSSWLDLDNDDATWLAGVADEVDATAGTRIGHRRFVHVVLTGADAGLVVGTEAPPVALSGAASVLVLTVSDMRELERRRTRHAVRPVPHPAVRPAI